MELTATAILATISAICAIASFIIGRKKDIKNEGADGNWLKQELTYVRNNLDDLRLDVKDIVRKQSETNEKLIRMDEKVNNLEKRVNIIEKDLRK